MLLLDAFINLIVEFFANIYNDFSNIPKRFSQITRKCCQEVEWDFSEYYWRLLDITQDYFPADC